MRSPVNVVKAVSSRIQKAAKRGGKGRSPLRRWRGAGLGGLSSPNPGQFRNYPEIVRSRDRIIDWLEAEKERRGLGGNRPLQLARRANNEPAVEACLKSATEGLFLQLQTLPE
ncbi:MAG: hypothetical protein V1493_04485 [Candidatus Diapherotrites archaeon]